MLGRIRITQQVVVARNLRYMLKIKKTKNTPTGFLSGFTLMEVVVGTLIISLVFGGLIATFLGVKRYVSRATRRVVTTNLDRQTLNSLYKDVRADTWDAGALSSAAGAGVTHNTTAVGLGTTVTIDNFDACRADLAA